MRENQQKEGWRSCRFALSNMKSEKPFSSKKIFWDIDSEELDYVKHSIFIITRVFDRGDVEDIRVCRRFYGDAQIKETLLSVPFLSKLRLSLASAIINEPKEAFRCYTSRRLSPEQLPY